MFSVILFKEMAFWRSDPAYGYISTDLNAIMERTARYPALY